MEYASMTFWLFVIVLSALGVHRLWSSLVQPKVVNSLLLPGTLVAQVGHIVGLLITGGTVNNTSLIKDDDSGEPQTAPETQSRIPVVGSIVIALLPLVGCAAAIYWVSRYFGTPILASMEKLGPQRMAMPTNVAMVFDSLRGCITLAEQFMNVVQASDYQDWRTWLFLYLVVCLTVRMAPLTGNLRGSLGAILLTGGIAFLIAQVAQSSAGLLESAWPLVVFSTAVLLFLLLVSLLVKGLVLLAQTLYGKG